MVIAWDRRSGVSRNIPRWFHPTPGSDPTRAEHPSCRDGYAILVGGARVSDLRGPGGNGSRNVTPGGEILTTGGGAAALETQGICRPGSGCADCSSATGDAR
jgi:hypothetical protein